MFIVIDATGKVQAHSATALGAGEGQRVIQTAPEEWAAIATADERMGAALEAAAAAAREVESAREGLDAAHQAYGAHGAALVDQWREAEDSARQPDGSATHEIGYDEQAGRFVLRPRAVSDAEKQRREDLAAIAAKAKDDPAFAALARMLNVGE